MDISYIYECLRRDLSLIKICSDKTSGNVRFYIDKSSECIENQLVKGGYDNKFNRKDNDFPYISEDLICSILYKVSDNLIYYSDYVRSDNLIGAWWYLNVAINELENEDIHINSGKMRILYNDYLDD